jgi:hypothetical protein
MNMRRALALSTIVAPIVLIVATFLLAFSAHAHADPRNDPQYLKCLRSYLLTHRLQDLRSGPDLGRMSTRQIQHNPFALGLVRDGRKFCWTRGNPS